MKAISHVKSDSFCCAVTGDWAGATHWCGAASCCCLTPRPSREQSSGELGLDQQLTAVGGNQSQRGPCAYLPTGWQEQPKSLYLASGGYLTFNTQGSLKVTLISVRTRNIIFSSLEQYGCGSLSSALIFLYICNYSIGTWFIKSKDEVQEDQA